jgi:hypothetical protein
MVGWHVQAVPTWLVTSGCTLPNTLWRNAVVGRLCMISCKCQRQVLQLRRMRWSHYASCTSRLLT